jgi:hypothetical protein
MNIDNEQLNLDNVPSADAHWSQIYEFALTFDGYEFWGSFEKCSEVANARAHGTLTGLRTCLFFEQRVWRNGDEQPPNAKTARYLQSLIRKIRALISRRSNQSRTSKRVA